MSRQETLKRYNNSPKGIACRARYAASEKGKAAAKKAYKDKLEDGRSTEYARRWRDKNPEKWAAHIAVKSAIRSGKLVKAERCENCGADKPEAHHQSYEESQHLVVQWLCRPCHNKAHDLRKDEGL